MTGEPPGRNDPCPCGSGRTYESCCLETDRKARSAGVDALRPTPELARLLQAESVWQTELVPLGSALRDDPGARPALALVTAGDFIVWAELYRRPSGDPEVVADLLADTVLSAVDRVEPPAHLLVQARHPDVVSRLGERVAHRGVEVEHAEWLDTLDILAAAVIAEWHSEPLDHLRRPCVSTAATWEGWALPEPVVAELFEAAAAFYGADPWRVLDDDAPLSIETASGRVWAASVLGNAGIEQGLSLYSDPADRRRIMETPGWLPPPDDFTGRNLCLSFTPFHGLPSAMRREVMRAGWKVAASEAYPHLFTINTPGGGVSAADAADLTAALRAVAAGTEVLEQAWTRGQPTEWRDRGTGFVVRLDPPDDRARSFLAPGWPPDSRRAVGDLDSDFDLDVDNPFVPRVLPPGAEVHRLRVSLEGTDPIVWRRFEVPSRMPLWALHEILQAVMGWEGTHLYSFEVGGVEYGDPDPDDWLEFEDADIRLSEVAGHAGDRMLYLYDFGDDWIHRLRVEVVEPADTEVRYPRCLDGAGACPPEDCGGPGGYRELLALLADPDPDPDDLATWLGWVGDDFDPEAFDVEEVNGRLDVLVDGPTLDPACQARFEQVKDLLEEASREFGYPPALSGDAGWLLHEYALAAPAAFLGAHKLEVLAAGALHAAGMHADPAWKVERLTLEELAEHWGVSSASVSARSLAMRDEVTIPASAHDFVSEATAEFARLSRALEEQQRARRPDQGRTRRP